MFLRSCFITASSDIRTVLQQAEAHWTAGWASWQLLAYTGLAASCLTIFHVVTWSLVLTFDQLWLDGLHLTTDHGEFFSWSSVAPFPFLSTLKACTGSTQQFKAQSASISVSRCYIRHGNEDLTSQKMVLGEHFYRKICPALHFRHSCIFKQYHKKLWLLARTSSLINKTELLGFFPWIETTWDGKKIAIQNNDGWGQHKNILCIHLSLPITVYYT